LQAADLLLVLVDGAVAQFGPRTAVFEELAKQASKMNVVPMAERA
jgi:ABC-type protease/lipase transport system fused ATPase/permease subunit